MLLSSQNCIKTSQPRLTLNIPTGGLIFTDQVGWLGLKVGGRLAQPCIRQMNRVYGVLESVVSVLRRHRNSRGYYYYSIHDFL